MNLFVTDPDPWKCAEWLDDKRVKHMPRETLEMLHMAIYKRTRQRTGPFVLWGDEHRSPFEELYNHPVTQWVARTNANMMWTWDHGLALCMEYEIRFNKSHWLKDDLYAISHFIPSTLRHPVGFRNSSGVEHSNVFQAYKECLIHKWLYTDQIRPVTFTNKQEPYWFSNHKLKQEKLNFTNNGNKDRTDLPF